MRKPSPTGPKLAWPAAIRARYKSAVQALHEDLGTQAKILALEHILITESEDARRVRGSSDPYAVRRASDREALTRAKELAVAAKTVAAFMRDFPRHGGFIVGGALLALRETGLGVIFQTGELVGLTGPERPPQFVPLYAGDLPLAETMVRLCDQLAKSAYEHNPAGRGNWIWRTTIPGASYAEPIDQTRRGRPSGVDLTTVLGFHLVLWLRSITTPGGTMVGSGVPMPGTGRPHYRIAAEFVRCALDDEVDARNLEKRIKDVPDLRYEPWRMGDRLRKPKSAG